MLAALAIFFFLAPAALVVVGIADTSLGRGDVPRFAWRWHRALAPRFAEWARQRVHAGDGAAVATADVAGTEWPMFGTVFFLAATETLQDAARRDGHASDIQPASYAAEAIDAAAALLLDPANATWVKAHWGDDYLRRENVFYRMLLIRGLTSHARITGSTAHLPLLREQVESLAAELAAAPHGLLDDYPGESYPTDVLWAVAAIRNADPVLGTDHSALVQRFLAHCSAPPLLGPLGLPPYQADAQSGRGFDESRGCSNAGILDQAPQLSIDQAQRWYANFAQHFWQRGPLLAGFREFPHGVESTWRGDVDSGPVVLGYGFSATAFGLAAARANGRLDHAVPLSQLAIAGAWPLPDGTLLLPRLLSNAVDAPYLGEAGMLYIFTRTPVLGTPIVLGAPRIPGLVPLLIVAYLLVGTALLRAAWHALRGPEAASPRREVIATLTWAGLAVAAAVFLWRNPLVALALLLLAHAASRRIAGKAIQKSDAEAPH